MKIYITTPTVNLPPNFMKLALTGWLHDHPGVKSAAMIRKGVYNDDMLYRFLNEQGIDRINWSHYFKENLLFCKRLSKYIFYSSFSLLTFATKK